MAIKTMSWENQKLIYWFIDCFAYYLADKDISNLSSKEKTGISDYYRFQAKEKLKKQADLLLKLAMKGINTQRVKVSMMRFVTGSHVANH